MNKHGIMGESPSGARNGAGVVSRTTLNITFDGDTMSCNIAFTDEATEEVHQYLSKAVAYVNPRGGLLASPIVDIVERVLFNFTGD